MFTLTSPFLKKETVFDAINMLQNHHKAKSIHSVLVVQDFAWLKKGSEVRPINFFTNRIQRTQDLPPILISKGAFFIAKASDILRQRKRLPQPLIFFPLSHAQAIEIDNFEDLEFAKSLKGIG